MRIGYLKHNVDVARTIFFEFKINRLGIEIYLLGYEVYLVW